MPNNRKRTKQTARFKRLKNHLCPEVFAALKDFNKQMGLLHNWAEKTLKEMQVDLELPFTREEDSLKYEWCKHCENVDSEECNECDGKNSYQVQSFVIDDCGICPLSDENTYCTIPLMPGNEPPCTTWIGDEIIGVNYYDEL